MSRHFKLAVVGLLLIFVLCLLALFFGEDRIPYLSKIFGRKTVANRIEETQALFEQELAPKLRAAGFAELPTSITLVFFKDSKSLLLYARDEGQPPKFIKSYSVKAASGRFGPKLNEGDRQVPEGIYGIESLNPNSAYYLALRVNYPNEIDILQANVDKRENLGSNIMIHGNSVSIGCIAIGDNAISEIFHLATTTNLKKWKVLLAPTDLRTNSSPQQVLEKSPWMAKVYESLKNELAALPNTH